MGKKEKRQNPLYGKDPWRIEETEFDANSNFLDETIFALGNGYIGTRGTLEEGYDGPAGTSMEGTYLNGFYERAPIHYEETGYGYATHSEIMLNLPNTKVIQVKVEDEILSLFTGALEHYHRVLDLQQGVLRREMRWVSPKGKILNIETQRLVSFVDDRLMMIQYAITPVNFSGKITLVSMLDGHVHNNTSEEDPRMGSNLQGQTLKLERIDTLGDMSRLLQVTTHSKLQVLTGISHLIQTNQTYKRETVIHGQMAQHHYEISAEQGKRIGLLKAAVYLRGDRDHDENLWQMGDTVLKNALHQGWAHYHFMQQQVLDDFWSHSDVQIEGNDLLQQGIRYNMFQLFQSAGTDGQTNIPAKGLTSEGYQGHYFWDSEIYILPFFLYTQPWRARKLLEYRYNTLDKARERAMKLFRKPGALYPWRTITGIECSSYFPAGTAQYHINADIVYAIRQYVNATGDYEFIKEKGAEMIFETARIWMHLGNYSHRRNNHFCINTVTGPDEYTAVVNNNFYTNAMAKMHLQYACETAQVLQELYPVEYQRIASKIQLKQQEIEDWEEAAGSMLLLKDELLGIHPQDDSFLDKACWPFKDTPADHYPLLMHYHPLDIYRYQVCKQADVLLAMYLLSDQFTVEEKRANLGYYTPITTHDSSLSRCIFGIIEAEVGSAEASMDLFEKTARIDLDNHQGNSHHGIHTASMAGTWLSLVAGLAGMRLKGDELCFSPYLPEKWSCYGFRLKFRGSCIKVIIKENFVEMILLEGNKVPVTIFGKHYWVSAEKALTIKERGDE